MHFRLEGAGLIIATSFNASPRLGLGEPPDNLLVYNN